MQDKLTLIEARIIRLLVCGTPKYASQLTREDSRISHNSRYNHLQRLESREMVSSELEEKEPDRAGGPRRFFTITEKGIKAYQRWVRQMCADFGLVPTHTDMEAWALDAAQALQSCVEHFSERGLIMTGGMMDVGIALEGFEGLFGPPDKAELPSPGEVRRWARQAFEVIAKGSRLMPLEQLSEWEGVRGVLETYPMDLNTEESEENEG